MAEPDNKQGFTEEYVPKNQTVQDTPAAEIKQAEEPPIHIESERYGLTKPKRIIIRGTISK